MAVEVAVDVAVGVAVAVGVSVAVPVGAGVGVPVAGSSARAASPLHVLAPVMVVAASPTPCSITHRPVGERVASPTREGSATSMLTATVPTLETAAADPWMTVGPLAAIGATCGPNATVNDGT